MIKLTTQLKDRRKFFSDSAGLLFLASVGFLPNDLIAMGDEVWVKKWFETKSLDDTFTVYLFYLIYIQERLVNLTLPV